MLMTDVTDDFLAYLKGDRGYSERTILTYRIVLRDFEGYFRSLDGNLSWMTVDADIIRGWLASEMHDGRTGRTMNKKLSAIRSLYRYMRRTGRIEKNPVAMVKSPKATKPLPTFLKEAEMDRLFDTVEFPDSYEGIRDRTILMVFYNTGIRVSELIGLDVCGIDLATHELKVTGKRNKQRIVPFGKELTEALRDYLRSRSQFGAETTALFFGTGTRRISYLQVRRIVRTYLSLVTTQKKRSPHVLRHTFATVMLNHGADLESIRELLGHESIGTTEVYTHTTFAELKKEYEHAHPRA